MTRLFGVTSGIAAASLAGWAVLRARGRPLSHGQRIVTVVTSASFFVATMGVFLFGAVVNAATSS